MANFWSIYFVLVCLIIVGTVNLVGKYLEKKKWVKIRRTHLLSKKGFGKNG